MLRHLGTYMITKCQKCTEMEKNVCWINTVKIKSDEAQILTEENMDIELFAVKITAL